MEKYERQYVDRINHERVPEYDRKSLDHMLPGWVMNLKNYFGKDLIQNKSSYS